AYLKVAEALNERTPVREVEFRSPYTFSSDKAGRQARDTAWDLYVARRQANTLAALPAPTEFGNWVASPWFGRLRSFEIESDLFTPEHLEILLTAPHTAELRELNLSGSHLIIGESWAPLSRSKVLTKLESLALDGCRLETAGLQAIARGEFLSLKGLSIIGNR